MPSSRWFLLATLASMATRDEIASILRTGVAARRQERLGEAEEYLNQASAMCAPDQRFERALAERELGELARHRRDLKAAQAHYEQAVALLQNSPDQLKRAHTIRHLGDVHAELRNWPAAEDCFAEALSLYRGHPSPGALDLANAIRAHASLKSATGRHEEARPLWVEAGELYESLGIAAGVEECRRQAGQSALDKGSK